MTICPCGSEKEFDACCGPVLTGEHPAATPEEVMRARYSAYATAQVGFLRTSLHPDHRADFDEKATRAWAEGSTWHGLRMLETKGGGPEDAEGSVEFIATFTDKGVRRDHHELALFRRHEGSWYFVSGEPVTPKQVVRNAPKVGRNDPCPCGSGKKHKKCCGQ